MPASNCFSASLIAFKACNTLLPCDLNKLLYSNFSNNIEVVVNSTNVKTINILLKDGSGSYNILTTATRKTITRISTKKVLTISNLNSNVTVSIIYGTN